jgi:hypothetical protein
MYPEEFDVVPLPKIDDKRNEADELRKMLGLSNKSVKPSVNPSFNNLNHWVNDNYNKINNSVKNKTSKMKDSSSKFTNLVSSEVKRLKTRKILNNFSGRNFEKRKNQYTYLDDNNVNSKNNKTKDNKTEDIEMTTIKNPDPEQSQHTETFNPIHNNIGGRKTKTKTKKRINRKKNKTKQKRGGGNTQSNGSDFDKLFKAYIDKNLKQNQKPKYDTWTDTESRAAFKILVELILIPGKNPSEEQLKEFKCRNTYENIKESYAQLTGKPYLPMPMHFVDNNNKKQSVDNKKQKPVLKKKH